MDVDSLEGGYRDKSRDWGRLESESKFILEDALRIAGIKTHSLISRIKSLDSVRDKSARKDLKDPLGTLDDIVGVRVVCLLRSDIARIGKLVRAQFEVVAEDNKLDGSNVEVFGYQSVHFIVQLPKSCSGPRYEGLHAVRFEIQVRTLAMDAWSSLSHYLDYKSESDVPRDLRKDFFALSGLFYVADTHFEMFYAERGKSREAAGKAETGTPTPGQELNLDTLEAFLRRRYPDRLHSDAAGRSELVSELAAAGYVTLDRLQQALEASKAAFAKYEEARPPMGKGRKKYHDVGVVRISVAIYDDEYAMKVYPEDHAIGGFREFLTEVPSK